MIRSYRPLGASDSAALEQGVAAAVDGWWSRWLQVRGVTPAGVFPLEKDDLAPQGEGRWLSLRERDATCAAFWVSKEAGRALAGMMIDPDPVSTVESSHALVEGLVDRSLADLAHELLKKPAARLSAGTGQPEVGTFVPRAGDVRVDLQLGRVAIVLLLSRAFVDRALGKSGASVVRRAPALAPRWQVIQKGTIGIEVRLQETGLSVADVRKLRQHDVVMFDHRISRPLQVRVQAGPEIGACFLGCRGNRRAIKLVKKEEIIK